MHKDKEIDLIALDEEKSTATFIEVKWSTLNNENCQRILKDLKTKSQAFKWPRKKENLAIIAKKVTNKKQLQEKGHFILDLQDFKPL